MPQVLVDDALWTLIEPLLPTRRRRNRRYAGRNTDPGSGGVHRDSVRAAQRCAVEHAAARDGLRLRDDLLASVGALATGGRLETPARRAAGRTAPAGRVGSRAGRGRQFLAPRAARGKKTGPNPTDRRKAGSKHHVLTDAHGIPLVASLTAANRNDITELLPLVNALPPLRGRPGRPVRKPALIQGDRAYDSQPHRDVLHRRGIRTPTRQAAAPTTAAGSGGPGGSSSAHWPGSIGFVGWPCATSGAPVSTKPSSPLDAPWYVGTF